MIVIVKDSARPEQIEKLKENFESMGLQVHFSKGMNTTLLGLVGDTTSVDIGKIAHMPIWFTHAACDTIVPPEETAVPTYKRLKAAGAENVHFSYYDRVLDQTGMFKKEDGTPYEYFGHGSWIYTLNDDCHLDFDGSEVTVDGKPVTIFQWLALQHK